MQIKKLIEKIGKKRLNNWLLFFCIGLALNGFMQFIYLWFNQRWVISTWCWKYQTGISGLTFSTYLIWFIQVYSVLFIPLIVFLGFKFKSKFDFKKINYLSIFVLIFIFFIFGLLFKNIELIQWIYLFMVIYVIMILAKFNIVFSLSFSYLCFYSANMLWEMAEINITSFGTTLSYILVYGILIFVLYKLKVLILKNFLSLCVSFIPILFLWIYYYLI